jgi:hypothetical protein
MEKRWEYKGTVYHLLIDFKKAHDSVKRKVLYNIRTEFSIWMELVMLNKMYLNETCIKIHVGKNLSDALPIQNGMNKGMPYDCSFSTLL